MKAVSMLNIAAFSLVCMPLLAQDQPSVRKDAAQGESWTKALEDRSKRGTLHDASQRVRGDSGKWNDEPRLQHAPPISRKPPKMSLDDWADSSQRTRDRLPTSNDDNWLLFKTRQLDDNDRVWIERIERRGKRFTIVLCEAIWQGRYSKTFTYYNVFGVNLGKLEPGHYEAKWIIKPLVFRNFEGSGRPTDKRRVNWSKDEHAVDKNASGLSVAFTVVAASN